MLKCLMCLVVFVVVLMIFLLVCVIVFGNYFDLLNLKDEGWQEVVEIYLVYYIDVKVVMDQLQKVQVDYLLLLGCYIDLLQYMYCVGLQDIFGVIVWDYLELMMLQGQLFLSGGNMM